MKIPLLENFLSANVWSTTKKPSEEIAVKDDIESFAMPNGDGAVVIEASKVNYSFDLDLADTTNEIELIRRYRDISRIPEVSFAVDEIVNEMISEDEEGKVVDLILDEIEYSDNIKNKIVDEFETVLERIQFKQKSYDMVRRWYVDGRLYFHKIVDPKEGLVEARYISPTTIKKVVEIEKTPNSNGVETIKTKNEFFTYQPARKIASIAINNSDASQSMYNFNNQSSLLNTVNQLVKVSPKAIAYITSGIYDEEYACILSYLHPALKTANNLRSLEDSVVLYRLARAPERKVFYIGVGNLPPQKAEQYLKDTMNKFRTNLHYDALTGEIKDGRRNMSMLEDFWLPRREDGASTEIQTLESGANLGEVDDLELFKKKLYRSLNVPLSRMQDDVPQIAGLGRGSEITRDEIKFQKFIDRLRNKFAELLIDLLITQLVAKKIIKEDETDDLKRKIVVKWSKDSFFVEMKETEILRERLTTLQMADPFLGKYFDKEFMMRKIMQMTEDEFKDMMKRIEKEPPIDPETGLPVQAGGFADTAPPSGQP